MLEDISMLRLPGKWHSMTRRAAVCQRRPKTGSDPYFGLWREFP
jgi:hypothetical protein